MLIRSANPDDQEAIWEIIAPIIAKGDTYVFHPKSSKEQMLNYWLGKDKYTFVALRADKIVGTYVLKDNHPDLGAHITNASYMVHQQHHGQGIGKAMGLHSINKARELGYKAMQFNFVVSTNHGAIKLWQNLGFKVIGTIPEAYQHQQLGLVDALIMHRKI